MDNCSTLCVMKQTILDGAHLWETYDALLAPYAQKNATSQGRKHQESVDPNRLPFQRDRDRVIHTKAFRRLRGKTQVVRPQKGDHFRNRLSHTIEVSQMARDLARALRLNEDLAETLALAHDLGHPPFGHAGERQLNEIMKGYGFSFEHNSQSLRVVEFFEQRYPDFPGLNLNQEVLMGLRKHDTSFVNYDGEKIYTPHLESQLVDISDSIAYLSADLEDSLRGGFVDISDLTSLALVQEATARLSKEEKVHRASIIRSVFRLLWKSLYEDVHFNLNKKSVQDLKDVQYTKERLIVFSDSFTKDFRDLKSFLFDRYYGAPEVVAETKKGQQIIQQLFEYYMKKPDKLPEQQLFHEEVLEKRICDHIAGMTDSFAEDVWRNRE